MGFVTTLLKDQEIFGRFLVVAALGPVILSLVDAYVQPVFYSLVLLLFLMNFDFLKRSILSFLRADPVYKLNLLFFGTALVVIGYIMVVGFALKPTPLFNGILALLTYAVWQSQIIGTLEKFPYQPIMRGEVDSFDLDSDYSVLVIPMTLATFIAIVVMLFESFILSMTQEIFLVSSLRWIVFIAMVLVHTIFHARVLNEFTWTPTNGVVSFIPKEIMEPPSVNNPEALTRYFSVMATHEEPTIEVLSYIEDNLDQLVVNFRSFHYISALHQMVRMFSYWGEKGREGLHMLSLCVIASFSRFRALGLVPLYNRYMFYSYMELLYKVGYLPEDWVEILRFEMENQRDDYHRLDWIFGLPYTDGQANAKWISFHNGKIYKGPLGYELLKQQVETDHHGALEDLEKWIGDCWELTFEYLLLFVGPKSATAFEGKFSLDEAIDFLARKEVLEDYQIKIDQRKEDLLNPKERLVDTEKAEENLPLTAYQMKHYLSGGSYNDYDEPVSELSKLKGGIMELVHSGSRFWLRILLLVGIAVLNLYMVYLLSPVIDQSLIQAILVIEIVGAQFLSITIEEERETIDPNDAVNVQNQNKQFNLDSGFQMFRGFSLIYSFFLLAGYGLMASRNWI